MANPFATWTKEQAEAHNAKVAASKAAFGDKVSKVELQQGAVTPYQKEHAFEKEFREAITPKGKTVTVYPDLTPRADTDEANLNKTERAYLAHLRMLKVPQLRVQKITLKLAHDCRFTPDMSYVDCNGRGVFVDVKGFQREDALIKAKMAARLYSEYRFLIVKRTKTGWDETEVKP